ncbi:uncharacterized protein BBOV_IV011610 [Babesia bovis T2Bo]|uniref:Uncharacterized protein n=1 Tax=Babesia bovis TaxID=5865 RepID=A7ASJ4_BABBO|nr:uncharacterized protein BBOV_IV011610 [Babesia bovis T2Bo]EDO07513.1 hypothetical protein BBOV_IV011610 [Babesia bovis T2Bo]|eukprot:XP_001611081.1 hypothetical protein [Babesia bovis T2Bo]
MMLNARRVVADNFKQAMDAGSFNLVALDTETNKEACTTINNIWVRDFINDLQLLKLDYINNRYNSASQQLLKQPMEETTFLDVGFDEPFDKMVVYYWSYYLKKCYDDLMHNATQLHTKWSKLKEKINTTPAVVES